MGKPCSRARNTISRVNAPPAEVPKKAMLFDEVVFNAAL
jgi:hypothetical protein